MNSGFHPKVVNPNGFKKQTQSAEFQTPFFFGGSQVPIILALPEPVYNGSKGSGFKKGIKLDRVSYHKDGHFLTTKQRLPFMK